MVVFTPRRLDSWTWRGATVRYATVAHREIWGSRVPDGVQIACPERAILDSLAHPRWGVTVLQVAQAIDLGLRRGVFDARSLTQAAKRYGNAETAGRVGYLLSLAGGEHEAAPFLALRGRTKAITPLLARGPRTGVAGTTWRVRVNIDPDHLTAHRNM